jgi:hypothetical protein
MIWRIGMRVVCIDSSRREAAHWKITFPVEGAIYEIRGLDDDRFPESGSIGIYLREIINPAGLWLRPGGIYLSEPSFDARRFRRLVKTRTDISIFHRMLNPSRMKEPVS